MASNHDAKVPFGMEIPQGNRKIIILRHKLCLKIQDGGIGKPVAKRLRAKIVLFWIQA